MFKFAIVAATVFGGGGQPVFAQAAISEPVRMRFIIPVTCHQQAV